MHNAPHKSEIHVLISPDSTADTELPEYGIHIREPAQGIFYRSLINNTEFSTVQCHSGIFAAVTASITISVINSVPIVCDCALQTTSP